MTDHPMIFSGPMVRALIDGRKTQTRRVIEIAGWLPDFCGAGGHLAADWNDPTCWGWEDSEHGDWVTIEREPGHRMSWRDWRGAFRVGDRIWVKETWQRENASPPFFRADGADWRGKWRPSIFMPRSVSRLTLIVTEVRILRLQDVDEDDARAEGAERMVMDADGLFYLDSELGTFRCGFAGLWNSLNAKRGRGWDANPWVAALTFTVRIGNIDEDETK